MTARMAVRCSRNVHPRPRGAARRRTAEGAAVPDAGRDGVRRPRAARGIARLHAAARRPGRSSPGAARTCSTCIACSTSRSQPLHPDIPLIFGSGVLTGIVPSAARGNATSWSPESGVLMDSNAGDYFPSFIRMNGIDHIVLFGKSGGVDAAARSRRARSSSSTRRRIVGLDNIDLRERIPQDFGGTWDRDLAMVNVTRAGENQVLTQRDHGRAEGLLRARRSGREDGIAEAEGDRRAGADARLRDRAALQGLQPRRSRRSCSSTSVVKHALKTMGTPFLYKPSRMLGAMGTKNNQETTWTDKLDAEHITPYRPGWRAASAAR